MELCDVWILSFSQIFECNILFGSLFIKYAIQITDLALVSLLFLGSCFSEPWFFSDITLFLVVNRSLHFSNVLSVFLVKYTKSICVSLVELLELTSVSSISLLYFFSISCKSQLVNPYSLIVFFSVFILLLWLSKSVGTFLLLPLLRCLFELQLTGGLLVCE